MGTPIWVPHPSFAWVGSHKPKLCHLVFPWPSGAGKEHKNPTGTVIWSEGLQLVQRSKLKNLRLLFCEFHSTMNRGPHSHTTTKTKLALPYRPAITALPSRTRVYFSAKGWPSRWMIRPFFN